MERTPKDGGSQARAERLLRHLADVARESMKPGGSISLEEAFRELEERERREAETDASDGQADKPGHHPR